MTGRLDDIGGIEWLTFDCYGTLVDWEAGMQGSFRALGAGVEHHRAMIEAYIRTEAAIEQQGYQPYRDIQRIALARVAREFGLTVSEHQQDLLSTSLPRWPVFGGHHRRTPPAGVAVQARYRVQHRPRPFQCHGRAIGRKV
jgi:FMN phosphatase YigB (HAD superfamily)